MLSLHIYSWARILEPLTYQTDLANCEFRCVNIYLFFYYSQASSWRRPKSKIFRFDTLGDWWNNLKILIRKSCVNFSARKRRALNHSRTLLTKQLIRAKRDFHTGAASDDSAVKSLQGALSALVLQETEGALELNGRGRRKAHAPFFPTWK